VLLLKGAWGHGVVVCMGRPRRIIVGVRHCCDRIVDRCDTLYLCMLLVVERRRSTKVLSTKESHRPAPIDRPRARGGGKGRGNVVSFACPQTERSNAEEGRGAEDRGGKVVEAADSAPTLADLCRKQSTHCLSSQPAVLCSLDIPLGEYRRLGSLP
jgi:hypothetical protein